MCYFAQKYDQGGISRATMPLLYLSMVPTCGAILIMLYQEEEYIVISQSIIYFSSNSSNCPEYQYIVQEI